MPTSLYYVPSGRVPRPAYPIVALTALATLPVAWLYAWLTIHVPAIFNLFVTILYGAFLGVLAAHAVGRGKVRDPAWGTRAGLAIGLAGWYFQSAAWIALVVNMVADRPGLHMLALGFTDMALHPRSMLHALVALADVGTWRLAGQRIAGFTLAVIWLIEFSLLVGFARMLGRSRTHDPFCETSGTWADKMAVPRKFAFIDRPHAARASLERQPGDVLSVLAPWSGHASPDHARVLIHRCRGEDSYLSIDNVAAKIVKDKIDETATPVVIFLRLPGIDPDALLSELTEAGAAAAPVSDPLPVPKELEVAFTHMNEDRHEAVLAAASDHTASDNALLRTDANRMCALACCRLGRWETARNFWQALFNDEPGAHSALQVATSSVTAGDLAAGASWMERARSTNATTREMPSMTIETNYLTALTQSGNVQAALPYLEQVRNM